MNFFDLHCDTATEAMKIRAGLRGSGLQLDLAACAKAMRYSFRIPCVGNRRGSILCGAVLTGKRKSLRQGG